MVDRRAVFGAILQQEGTRCGKPRCKRGCRSAGRESDDDDDDADEEARSRWPHGPFWYHYTLEQRGDAPKLWPRKRYLGTEVEIVGPSHLRVYRPSIGTFDLVFDVEGATWTGWP
ncbi:MAG: hypothetical protein R3B09_32235 [Nannocystaceae bacterium]